MIENELDDLIIIGAGPVGLFGAFYAGLRGMKTKIIDSLPELGGQLTALYPEKYIFDMPGFPKIMAKELVAQLVQQAMSYNPTVVLEERCTTLEQVGDNWKLGTTKGHDHFAKTIIIAAGAGAFSPKKLIAPGVLEFEGKGVYYGVPNKNIFEGQNLVIVGGGDSAVDWALQLEPIAKKVTLVHRRDGFRAHEESLKQLSESTVDVRTFWEVKEITGSSKAEHCTIFNNQTKEEETFDIDTVIFSLGFTANIGQISDWGLELNGHQIIVNAYMETNLPGVYAAGDIAEYDGKIRLMATGTGEVTAAVCYAKNRIDPDAKVFPGHSSDMHSKKP
jgi:thioredoxin reductase (NADPH)